MKFIKISSPLSQKELTEFLKDSELVNKNVKFEKYIPEMHTKESKSNPAKIRITCEIKNTATKDNGFLVGTYFSGKFTEKNGITYLKGHIATAPIYHTIIALILAFFVYRCISFRAFNPVPIVLLIFDIFMFWREFKKQGMIERYIYRAFRKAAEKREGQRSTF